MVTYAGIGSRKTPEDILILMQDIAAMLGELGYILRTGGADGADSAFEIGCIEIHGDLELWAPYKNFKNYGTNVFLPTEQHTVIAATLHPVWDRLPKYAQLLHSRNVGQILGQDCNTPVNFVVCWTPDGCESHLTRTSKTGGTGTAIALASQRGIPIFNLKNPDALDRLKQHIQKVIYHPSKFNCFYDGHVDLIPKDMIFVFGSNLAGRHGLGAAKTAVEKYGAVYGSGIGLYGQSYAIPTKDKDLKIMSLDDIRPYIDNFVWLSQQGHHRFFVTPIGCGLAKYTAKEIAPLFKGVQYCWLPEAWKTFLF